AEGAVLVVLDEEHHRVVEERTAQARCCDEQAGRELRGHAPMLPPSRTGCHRGSRRICPAAVDVLSPVRTASRVVGIAAWTASVVYAHRAAALVRRDLDSPSGKAPFIAAWSRGVFPMFGI